METSPFISVYIYKCLDNALDCGITEFDFWNMTLAEINRAVKSRIRVKQMEAKERATFDYILANLIGANVGRILSSENDIPPLEEVYSSLFADEVKQKEEQKVDKQTQLFIARLKQFTELHNKKLKGGGKDSE